MKPSDEVILTLANELGNRLKRNIGAEVEDLLAQFLEEMKRSPQKILHEAGAQQDRILKLLDEQLHSGEDQGTRFEQELERLMKKSEIALKDKAEAQARTDQALREKTKAEELHQALLNEKSQVEQKLAELETSSSQNTDELKARIQTYKNELDEAVNWAETRLREKIETEQKAATIRAEKAAAEKEKEAALSRATEAEKKSHASDLIKVTLEEKLKSSRKVPRTVAVILSIITLATAGYIIFSIQSYHERIKSLNGLVEKLGAVGAGIDQKDAFIDALNRSQAPVHVKLDALNQKVTPMVQQIDRPPVKSAALPESKTVFHRILTEFYFQPGYVDITKDNAAKISSLAQTLKTKPDTLIRIEGHTDDKPLRWPSVEKYVDNIGLSQARALAAARLFIKAGVAPGRISYIGLGATRPFAPNDSPENRAKNRRVVIKAADKQE